MTQGELKIIEILASLTRYESLEVKKNEKGLLEWTKKRTEKGEVDLHADKDRV